MRTEIVTTEYKIYKYSELSNDAKETVKRWYLDGQEPFIFTEDVKQDLYNLFGKNNLNVQYSLSCCQGDGFNIYGSIDAESIFKCLENHNGGNQLAKFENMLTEKEKRTILNYSNECYMIELPMNNRYCYSLADYIDVAEDWEWKLNNYSYYKNINTDVLNKFEKLVRGIFSTLCSSYEKWGYDFFYEIDESDLEEICECNGWEFLADGTPY